MRISKDLLAVLAASLITLTAKAQDVHYSMFDMAPLTLNPANTGNYEGSFRIGGIYRDQWNNISNASGFRTPNIYVDLPLISLGKQKMSFMGFGLNFINDRRGTAALNNTGISISAAGHFALGSLKRSRLSIGLQGGIAMERIDQDQLQLSDQWDPNNLGGGPTGATTDNLANQSVTYPDFAAGLMFSSVVNQKFSYELGFSSQHLAEPDEAFMAQTAAPEEYRKRPRKYVGHAQFDWAIANRISLYPKAFYQLQQKASEINVQTLLGFHFNQQKDITLLAGAGYRVGESIFPRVGLNIKNFRLGVAYDINVGSLSSYTQAHSFEVAVSYIARIYPKIVRPPRIFCPRF